MRLPKLAVSGVEMLSVVSKSTDSDLPPATTNCRRVLMAGALPEGAAMNNVVLPLIATLFETAPRLPPLPTCVAVLAIVPAPSPVTTTVPPAIVMGPFCVLATPVNARVPACR